MRYLSIIFALICLPLPSLAENTEVLESLEEYLAFAEYAEGAITHEQMSSVGKDQFYLIDTRLQELFAKHHIPGAVNIDWRQVVGKRDEIPKDRPVVLYCDTGLLSSKAHFALRLLGRENVKVLLGGYDGWLARQERTALD
jgi:rhodanese-related sulfurtransferase